MRDGPFISMLKLPALGASCAAFFFCLYFAAPVIANPLDAIGFGPRAISLGGAFTAVADDFSANYYNPAGLSQANHLQLSVGYLYNSPDLRFNGNDSETDQIKGVQFGFVLPGEIRRRHLAAGIGLFILDDRITRIRSLPEQQPRFVLYDNRVQRLFLSTNLSVEVWEDLHLGFGVNFMANTSGTLNLEGVVSTYDSQETALQSDVDVEIESARYVQAGILYTPRGERWSLGLVVRQEYYLKLDLGTFVQGDIVYDQQPQNPIVLVEDGYFLFDSSYANLFSPLQVVLGGRLEVGALQLSGDLGWYRWSHFPAPTADMVIELELPGLSFPLPQVEAVAEPRFSDLIIPRLGAELRLIERPRATFLGRMGYFFEDSPAPDQPGATNYADSARHGLSLGFGVILEGMTDLLPGPLSLDASMLYLRLVEREYEKSDPADVVGDYFISGNIFGLGIQLGVSL